MAKDYSAQPINQVRRSDRAVHEETWMQHFLQQAAAATLATVHEGQPFLNTNLFVYDAEQHCVYIHTARVGRTRANVEQDPRAAFTVMEMGRLLPADEALEFSVEYAGITLFGTVRVIEDDAEATRALQMMLDKYSPHLRPEHDYRPPMPEELLRTTVMRLDIAEWSGKKKEVGEFAAAHRYPDAPMLASNRTPYWQGTLSGIWLASQAGALAHDVASVEAIAGEGLLGDRYRDHAGTFSARGGAGREVTLIAQESLDALAHDHQLTLTPQMARRNLVTLGVPLNDLVGREFWVGGVLLRGVRLCEPCQTLAESSGLGAPLIQALLHRGGLRADIVRGGLIQTGDRVRPLG